MSSQSLFSEYTLKHFAFLQKEFDFSLVEDEFSQAAASCIIAFQNKWRYVRLVWGLKDCQFYFGVYRMINGQPAAYADYSSDHFYIVALAMYYEPSLDMKALVDLDTSEPAPQILDGRIKSHADLLYKYGRDILQGKAWYDWQTNKIVAERPGS